ncbi:leukocyte receptor cluster member 1 homolog isoform X2 [Limulus polyphemus]|uniref:Leukocyte receptor cluster member 1 homolog isoform X2 n=1 Tax=Limulus polyphemus TaxID=6850 RepID=A0ABM1BFA3_LIMPO|nr:leukocyte receptor cluster member 1 homolog isoform X2 [Limulus polyphemus]
MNILPKKRWHVRTKDNIARVRRDEAEARRKDEEEKRRSQLAEQEARINFLQKRTSMKSDVSNDDNQAKHVNFFKEIEDGEYCVGTNKDHEDEKKKKREDFEKKIGLLNYLQDSVSGQNLWYLESPGERIRKKDGQSVRNVDEKEKPTSVLPADPLIDVQQYLKQKHLKEKTKKMSTKQSSNTNGKKHKQGKGRRKKHLQPSDVSVEQLRAERLQREKEERERTEKLLRGLHKTSREESGDNLVDPENSRYYNMQFHPELARQSKHKLFKSPSQR